MNLDQIVSLTIFRNTRTISQAGFGTLGIFGYHTNWVDYNRSYLASTMLSTLVSEGFATTDPIYLAANAAVSQNPHLQTIEVLRRQTAQTYHCQLTITADTGDHAVTVSKGSTSRTYGRTGLGTGVAAEATALAAEMNADASGWGTAGTTELTITAPGAGVVDIVSAAADGEHYFFDTLTLITIDDQTADAGAIASDLNNIKNLGTPDYYCLVGADTFSHQQIDNMQTWIESESKIAVHATQDSDVPTSSTTDIASELQDDSDDQCVLLVKKNTMAEMGHAAWAGRMLSTTPGDSTWAYKVLTGVSPDVWSATEMQYIGPLTDHANGKNANHFTTTAGVNHTYAGIAPSGEYLDITRLTHYVEARIKEAIFTDLVNNEKLPFDDDGLGTIKAGILRVIRERIPNGFVDGSEYVSVPAAADITAANKAARNAAPITFGAQFAGAIHKTAIQGTLYL